MLSTLPIRHLIYSSTDPIWPWACKLRRNAHGEEITYRGHPALKLPLQTGTRLPFFQKPKESWEPPEDVGPYALAQIVLLDLKLPIYEKAEVGQRSISKSKKIGLKAFVDFIVPNPGGDLFQMLLRGVEDQLQMSSEIGYQTVGNRCLRPNRLFNYAAVLGFCGVEQPIQSCLASTIDFFER